MQLSNWVLQGKLVYWFQGLKLPKGVIKLAKQIIYKFIWVEGKGMSWRRIALSKNGFTKEWTRSVFSRCGLHGEEGLLNMVV